MSKEAMKLALEALEMYLLETNSQFQRSAVTALREALAEHPAQQEPVALAHKHITAMLAAFGPDEAISMTKETWAKLREAIKTLAEQPAQQQENVSADAYDHACEEMERWQHQRRKAGKEVGTTGSLCDGISWLYGYIDELEAKTAQQQEPVTDEENEKFSRDVSNFKGADPEATKYALESFLKGRMAEQPAQQEPVAKVCHDLDGHIGWNPNLRQLPDEGTALYTSPPTLSLAQRPHECSRSHPHENMNAMCELRTEIARLTNENARLKALHQGDEINTYRMTLLCIRDGLQQGMSKSIQKLQAREINDVLGLPSFASYRTSPPAQRTWVGLTDEEWQDLSDRYGLIIWGPFKREIEAKLRSKNEDRN